MTRQHKIKVTETLKAAEVDLTNFTAEITVNIHPESGNGWDEPRESRGYELDAVTQVSGPFIRPDLLATWAETWVETNYQAIDQIIAARFEGGF